MAVSYAHRERNELSIFFRRSVERRLARNNLHFSNSDHGGRSVSEHRSDRNPSVDVVNAGPVTSGLVGYWGIDEGANSTALDSSGNEKMERGLVPKPELQAIIPPASSGPWSGTLNGTNDYAKASFSTSSLPITITAWFQAYATGESGVIISYLDNTQSNWYGYYLGVAGQSHSEAAYNSSFRLGSSLPGSDTNWHNIVAIYNGAASRQIYVDGVRLPP